MVSVEKVTPIWYQQFSDRVDEFNQESVQQWNECDLEGFCTGYAEDAVMVTNVGISNGRQTILQAYLTSYPDRSRMGTISVKVVDIRFPPDNKDNDHDVLVSMATAIVHCIITLDGSLTEDSYSMVTFILDPAGEMYIVQDTSN
jgi:uncharacterized protein (TIGR02246 family)